MSQTADVLKTRLRYAYFKVKKGWEFKNLKEIKEIFPKTSLHSAKTIIERKKLAKKDLYSPIYITPNPSPRIPLLGQMNEDETDASKSRLVDPIQFMTPAASPDIHGSKNCKNLPVISMEGNSRLPVLSVKPKEKDLEGASILLMIRENN